MYVVTCAAADGLILVVLSVLLTRTRSRPEDDINGVTVAWFQYRNS